MTAPDSAPVPAPRQRFPTKKQALIGCFGSVILSLTTCMSVIIVFGERQLNDFESFLVGLTVYVCIFAPVGGLVVLIMYFVRRRSNKRQENHAS